jgi:hypothetical protein
MDNIERTAAVFRYNLRKRAEAAWPGARIVHERAEQIPRAGPGFLLKGEHMNLVCCRQALDQPEQTRDDLVGPGPIHTARHYDGDFHEQDRARVE